MRRGPTSSTSPRCSSAAAPSRSRGPTPGIETIEDLAGTRVGTWGFGNEFELTAALTAAGLDPDVDVEIVQQPFDMSLLLNDEVDAAQAMTYNEYAQVLEAKNPDTGELYQPEDLNVIDFNERRHAMLQDAVWADDELARRGATTRTSPRGSCGRRSGGGSTAATTSTSASRSCSTTARPSGRAT